MALRSEQLHLLYARRREQEAQKIQRTAAVNRYYDQWSKITSRHENLAGAAYYKQAEAKFAQNKERKEKEIRLEKRREQLKKLFGEEQAQHEAEMRARERPRSRKINASNETLEKINESVVERDNLRRKLELEAKLYGQWRHGVDDETRIFDSRSNNEVLAKLNWLDNKIEEEKQREKEQAEAELRNLQLQQEMNKMAELQKEQQILREQQLKEIRALQCEHMEKMQEMQNETDELKKQEKLHRSSIEEVEKELELLNESFALVNEAESAETSNNYNLRRIKLLIRNRSELVREHIKMCISMLERMIYYSVQKEKVCELKNIYQEDLENESFVLSGIEAMYESEAKYGLQKCQEAWQLATTRRMCQMKSLLNDEIGILRIRLDENLKLQEDIVKIRETHLTAIENANENLKKLAEENKEVAVDVPKIETPAKTAVQSKDVDRVSESSLAKLTNSFTNLNLDVWKDHVSSRQLNKSASNMSIVTADNAERPKFARRRVAWN